MSTKNRNFILLFIFLLLNFDNIEAQNLTVNSSIISSSDNTYVLFGQGFGNRITKNGVENLEPLLFEAQLAPLFTLQFNKKVPFGFVLSPKILVRMFHESSNPVKSPSYMPFILIYHKIKFPILNRYNMFKSILAVKPTFFATYKYGHHSNGASGPYFIPNSREIDIASGSFSTDYTEVAFSFLSGDTIHKNFDLISGRIAGEYHIGLNREDSMRTTYYYERINLELRFIAFKTVTIVPIFSAMFGENGFTPKYSMDTYISFRPFPKKSDLAVFAKIYIGPDYYNIRYVNTMRYISFGILIEPKGLAIIKRK
ncbi:MAG: hypothetical protein H7141_14900 [Burkholderiales bacterium]|nr:hypothetical protein [Bacteroidia bacterium]